MRASGVAVGQVVVDGDDVDALAFERVQVHGESGDQRLAFTGLHLGDLAAVQYGAADELYVEVPHIEHAAAGFAADGESRDEQVVELGSVGDLLLEFDGLGGPLGVGELLRFGLEVVDGGDERAHLLYFALVRRPENFRENRVDHGYLSFILPWGQVRPGGKIRLSF